MMFKTVNKTVLIPLTTMALSASAFSNEISYDYVQAAYVSSTDSSLGFDIDATGYEVEGSFSLSQVLALEVSAGSTSVDDLALGDELEISQQLVGITLHNSISPTTDLFGTLSLLRGEIEINAPGFFSGKESDTGNQITVGLRHMASDTVEIGVNAFRQDVFDFTSNMINFNARIFTSERLSFGAEYSTGDDVDTLLLNVRIGL